MKKKVKLILVSLLLLLLLSACESGPSNEATYLANGNKKTMEFMANNELFKVKLANNQTVKELLKALPESFTMRDLNQNEKYVDLEQSLPTQEQRIKSIKAGDVMLFGDRALVIFYQSFETNYSYTRIGRIEEPEYLGKRLGTGNVEIKLIKRSEE